jgi:hypothetical protein
VVVDELGGGLAVDEVLEAVPLREDDILVPLAHIDLHRRVLAELPERALGVEHHTLAVQAEDAATALLVCRLGSPVDSEPGCFTIAPTGCHA